MDPAPTRVGIVLPIEQGDGLAAPPPYREIRSVALAAEEAGLDSVWVFDHLLWRFGGETTGLHECWTVLSAIAEATERVELGTIVMCTAFRNPALLAKMAGTLDHVSDGRLILGVGCGWHDPEYEGRLRRGPATMPDQRRLDAARARSSSYGNTIVYLPPSVLGIALFGP